MKTARSRFYSEMRLARVLHEMELIDAACHWDQPSIICNQSQLKARVLWRELMSKANRLEWNLF